MSILYPQSSSGATVGTSTSTFGVSRRESHDSSDFYRRFEVPRETDNYTINEVGENVVDKLFMGSATNMHMVADNSVALMVTSPPYHAGKDYDTDQTFDEYLDLIHEVLAETYRVLQPGGRAAINVANLGRKPYIPLTTYVDAICNDIGYFPRGQIIWLKGEGASGNCAWGTFQSAQNPVLRDLHEYILVYSKGRFGRPMKGISTMSKEDFMAWTLSTWKIPPASAKRIGHPAPFPIELPRRLIELYTYQGDVVLDPMIGSGTTAIAALMSGRHYVGFETDPDFYVNAADRIEQYRKENNV